MFSMLPQNETPGNMCFVSHLSLFVYSNPVIAGDTCNELLKKEVRTIILMDNFILQGKTYFIPSRSRASDYQPMCRKEKSAII